jgi:hypothetical protein
MTWSHDWFWSLPLIVLTTVIHVVVLGFAASKAVAILSHPARRGGFILRFCVVIGATVSLATMLLAFEALLWAAAYLHVGAVSDYERAMLYSLGAITSYGHAEIFLAPRWMMMGALEALNGIMLFGLTTAFFFDVIQAVRSSERR